MNKRHTHNSRGSEWLVQLANGQGGLLLVQMHGGIAVKTADGETLTVLMMKNARPDRILSGLSAFTSEFIDRVIVTAPLVPFIWCERTAYSALALQDGERRFVDYPAIYNRKALPGWSVTHSFSPEEMDAVLALFDALLSREKVAAIDPERLGKCPVCGRYFISRGTGQRKSRACSKEHQSILSAREYRKTPDYQGKLKTRNTERMQNTRKAEKMFFKWIGEGLSHRESESRLRNWNEALSSPLGETALQNILDK